MYDTEQQLRKLKMNMIGIGQLSEHEKLQINQVQNMIDNMTIHQGMDPNIVVLVHEKMVFFEYNLRDKRSFILKWLYDELYFGPNFIDPRIIVRFLLERHFKENHKLKQFDKVYICKFDNGIGDEINYNFFDVEF